MVRSVKLPTRLASMAVSALFVCGLMGTASAEQLYPRDTTDQAPKFALFKGQLEQAVKDRNARFFRERTKGAKLSFGLPVDLDDRFDIDDPNNEFWQVMDRLMELGGVWQADSEMVVYPYAYANFPKDVNAFDHDVITAPDVPVYHASDGIHVDGELSYEVVWVLERGEEMSRVRAENGITGYVENRYLYSPVGYRMGLAMLNGRWTIVFLIAGD